MARVNNIQTDLQNVKDVPTLARFVGSALASLLAQFNGKVDVGDNIRASGPFTIGFLSANTAIKIPHSLARPPIGYWVMQQDAVGSIYSPNQVTFPWNDSQIYLAASAPMTAVVYVL